MEKQRWAPESGIPPLFLLSYQPHNSVKLLHPLLWALCTQVTSVTASVTPSTASLPLCSPPLPDSEIKPGSLLRLMSLKVRAGGQLPASSLVNIYCLGIYAYIWGLNRQVLCEGRGHREEPLPPISRATSTSDLTSLRLPLLIGKSMRITNAYLAERCQHPVK